MRAGCTVDGCLRPHYAKRYCNPHYQQLRAGHDPHGVPRKRRNGSTAVRNRDGQKQCSTCALWLPPDNFSGHPATADGLQVRCRACTYAARRFTQYALTGDLIAQIMQRQKHRCAICARDIRGRYTVDHDHACCPGRKSCGRCVRGFLCDRCNLGLGAFEDSPRTLRAAIDYLTR